jgi:hypothetical protein
VKSEHGGFLVTILTGDPISGKIFDSFSLRVFLILRAVRMLRRAAMLSLPLFSILLRSSVMKKTPCELG